MKWPRSPGSECSCIRICGSTRTWCEVRERRLFLAAKVPSFYHKQLAEASLKDMDGLEQIVNEIEVVW